MSDKSDPESLDFEEKKRRFSTSDATTSSSSSKAKGRLDIMEAVKLQKETELTLLMENSQELDALLKADKVDVLQIQVLYTYLSGRFNSFSKTHTKYLELLAKAGTKEEFTREKKVEATLQRSKVALDIQCQFYLESGANTGGGGNSNSSSSSTSAAEPFRPKLPKRELVKFNGDVRRWIAFWASFQEIHLDSKIPVIEKFYYLIQCMEPDTPAYHHVSSFHLQADNYPKVIDSIRNRYGRANLLIKVYVRDLLGLAITKSSEKALDFTSLVTQIAHMLENIESLGVTTDDCKAVLYPVVESCLPDDVLEAWQRYNNFEEDLGKLMKFLQAEVNNRMERTFAKSQFMKSTNSTEGNKNQKSPSWKKDGTPTAASLLVGEPDCCGFCNGKHYTDACRKSRHMKYDERVAAMKASHCCLKCSRRGHIARHCKVNPKCSICQKEHVTVLCRELAPPSQANQVSKSEGQSAAVANTTTSSPGTVIHTLVASSRTHNVPLQIVPIYAYGESGIIVQCRCVLDSGSQRSYITHKLVKELCLPKLGEESIVHDLFGGKQSAETSAPVSKVMVSSLEGKDVYTFHASTVDVILRSADPTPRGVWIDDFRKKKIEFEDINSTSRNVHVLIGNDILAKIYTGKIEHLPYGPSAMQTKLGWVLCGKLPTTTTTTTAAASIISTLIAKDRPVSDLWSLDTLGILDSSVQESREEMEKQALAHFNNTVKRVRGGRYEVKLPFLAGAQSALPSNYHIAERRLRSVTESIKKEGYFDDYDRVFSQWLKDEMIEDCSIDNNSNTHYLPHRAVLKEGSSTPLRPVFDASAKSKGKPSLNDCLEKGPNLLEVIPAILTRFRMYEFGVVADIRKAFQQISVSPEHRDYLRFLWWENDTCAKLKVFRHTRVVFGVSSSPFLLNATLQHHLSNAPVELEEAAVILRDNMYVDNLVASMQSLEEAQKFQQESQILLLPAQFDLRGWEFGPSLEEKMIPVLGLTWNIRSDVLSLDISSAEKKMKVSEEIITQRKVLSLCHSLFDPLGLIAPFTIRGKLILRQCHENKLGWDTELPQEIKNMFMMYMNQVEVVRNLKIPRHINFIEEKSTLHAFCDASSSAAAAAVFIRVEKTNGVEVHLLLCKSRVAPPKVTIPRLELLSCLIGARLVNTVRKYLQSSRLQTTLWSDSTTALTWIKDQGPWGVYVHNRVHEIRSLTEDDRWLHVPGAINPADLPSRGCSAKKLVESGWSNGPEWLTLPQKYWPAQHQEPDMNEVEMERRKTVVTTVSTLAMEKQFLQDLTVIPSYSRIVRVIARAYRFIDSCRKKERLPATSSSSPYINRIEKDRAESKLIQLIQEGHKDELLKMKKLNPYVDQVGVIRTRSRLTHDDTLEFLRPFLLPQNSVLVMMLIQEEHDRNSHAGVQFTLSSLRSKYWIVNGRRIVRQIINKCAICRRFTASRLRVPEASLPKLRTGEAVPFAVTGVDMAGPLHVKDKGKMWIALFTCATYRAVHMELVDTLSTDGFLQCLRRFVARRGRPHTIMSDNGLNFTGASKFLRRVNFEKVLQYANVEKMDWQFNPPSAPWWGGYWERLIGMVKQILRRILGNKKVSYDELQTLLIEVEEILNNRPLTTLSEDPEDLIPLTPNMFARNSGLAYVPEVDVRDAAHMRKAFKRLQKLREELRSRFRLEYLGFLRHHHTSKTDTELKPGDVVLIENELQKRLDWQLAVVVEAMLGRDNHVRAYRVRAKTGELVRPAQRLYPVEISK